LTSVSTGRRAFKRALSPLRVVGGRPRGATLLTYHRVGAGTTDELDTPEAELGHQLDVLAEGGHDVVTLDAALDRLASGDERPCVVLTFDDGFADVHSRAFPLLRERRFPFTLYVTAGLVGGDMRWEGSTAASQGAAALGWEQLEDLVASGLCTVGNHTFTHAEPHRVDVDELDRCSDLLEERLGSRPRHFAWTWGIEVPRLQAAVEGRFRSAATGTVGRNAPGCDLHALRRVPVRRTDPLPFFRAKLTGSLVPERVYAVAGRLAKRVRRG
jgi:peptidoglycan/xylan/chitin deacetylase (PgdA/CDA1 family)